jgi:PKD repeat protein
MTKSLLASFLGVFLSIATYACPTALNVIEQSCNNYVFYLAETPVGNVMWDFGDGSTTTGSIEIQHQYAANGSYVVSATFSGPDCPDTITLLAFIEVSCGEVNLCPTGIVAEAIDCDNYVLHVQGIDNADVSWAFGDGSNENGGIIVDHTWQENGVYVVTAEINAPQCPIMPPIGIITMRDTIYVECTPAVECPTEIWSGASAECGVINFEIGSFVEGENVTWFTGDNSGPQQGGHFFSHTYVAAGTYDVCAFYTSPLCPNGVELCTTIIVEPCEQPCNDIGFGIDSYVLDGGTPWLTYMISNVETGMLVTSGFAQYTENDPYFDTSLCLPDGCYYLTIDNNNPLIIGQGVNIFFILNSVNLMENATIVFQDNVAIRFLIGVNTNCGEPILCETAFVPLPTNTPGHVEFINNSVYSGNAEFLWEYGDGQTSTDFSGNVQYESNGVYNACLTITTVNCTYSSCQTVVVDNMESACAFNEVTIISEAIYLNPVIEEVYQLTIANGTMPIHEWTFISSGYMIDTLQICLPEGCYNVSLYSPFPIQAMSFTCDISGPGIQLLGDLQLNVSDSFTSAVIGVNMNCTIDVEEIIATDVRAFPNPATDNIQITSKEIIEHIEIFDMTGKRVATLNSNQSQVQFNTSAWSNGLYVAHVICEGKAERVTFEVSR